MEVRAGSFCRDQDCIIDLLGIPQLSSVPSGTRIQVQFEFMVSSSEIAVSLDEAVAVQFAGPCLDIKMRIKKPIEDILSDSIDEVITDERQIPKGEKAREDCHRFTGIGNDIDED